MFARFYSQAIVNNCARWRKELKEGGFKSGEGNGKVDSLITRAARPQSRQELVQLFRSPWVSLPAAKGAPAPGHNRLL